ncbi:MAG: triose-phosphate isomerase [Candidatus Bathyarchaeia archaeon]
MALLQKLKIEPPIIIINFKCYKEATGKSALSLAKIAEKISKKTGVCIAVAPQFTDIKTIANEVRIPVLAQHIDPIEPGAFTGHISLYALKEAGAIGSLINHSEKRIKLSEIDEILSLMKNNEMVSVLCTNTAQVSAACAVLEPEIIAIEPPELIGTGIAVSKAKPEIIQNTVSLIRKVNSKVLILCGAGITKGDDVKAALDLGSQGVLVASGVVKSKNPELSLYDLAESAMKAKSK